MDALLELPATLPPHDAAPIEPVPFKVIAEWPHETFLENLIVRADGSIVVSVVSDARLDHVDAAGRVTPLHRFDAPCTGLLEVSGGGIIVAVGEPGQSQAALWHVGANGGSQKLLDVPGATFLNGLAALAPSRLLAAESLQGRLYVVDLRSRTCAVWLDDARLTPSPQVAFLPGANGVKRFGDHVYVTSNSRALLTRVPILADGSAGRLEVIAERLRGDDLAFDTNGAIYLTTHIGHSLDRIDRAGRRLALGGPSQGLAGSTACAFGRAPGDLQGLYVTTTGGLIGPVDGELQPARLVGPVDGELQPARLVRLDLGGVDLKPVGAPVVLEWSTS